jgi:hypothetical protein
VLVSQNKNILFLTRPWNHAFFVKLSGQMTCEPWFLKENSLEKSGDDFYCSDLKENDIDEIIFCCRLLRILSRDEADLLIRVSYANAHKKLTSVKPDVVISLTVDNYHLDIFARICKKLNVKFLGLCNCPFPGFIRITERGEATISQLGPDARFINDFYESKKRPAHFIEASKTKVWLRGFNYWLRKVYYSMLSLFGDVSYHTQVNILWHKRGKVGVLRETRSSFDEKKIIALLPLQYTPECTIDYWAPVAPSNSYEDFLQNLIRANKDVTFIVKEHPMYDGQRISDFDTFLTQAQNCEVVNTGVSTYELMNASDVSATITGTVALESIFSNKPTWLLTSTMPYYFDGCEVEPGHNGIGHIVNPSEKNLKIVLANLRGMMLPGAISLKRRFLSYGWDSQGLDFLAISLNTYIEGLFRNE